MGIEMEWGELVAAPLKGQWGTRQEISSVLAKNMEGKKGEKKTEDEMEGKKEAKTEEKWREEKEALAFG